MAGLPLFLQKIRSGGRRVVNRLAERVLREVVYTGSAGEPWPLLTTFRDGMLPVPGPRVLVFGDSVMERVARQDTDRRTLGEMILARAQSRALDGRVVGNTAFTSMMFDLLLGFANQLGARPDHVVLPFNLRCLSPQWDLRPIWQFLQEQAAVQAMIVAPDRTPPALVPVFRDDEQYRATAFASPLSKSKRVAPFLALQGGRRRDREEEQARLRKLLIFHYGVPARPTHRQLAAFAGAVRVAREMGARVHGYLTPVNIQLIRDLGGRDLAAIVGSNAERVQETFLAAAGPQDRFGDWSARLSPDHFFHPSEVTEHLRDRGRAALAELVASSLDASSALHDVSPA